ncbi:hypothetical protein CONLIGDRAFT_717945, partial [Coniochaeta ligniaria NRRL 30616]
APRSPAQCSGPSQRQRDRQRRLGPEKNRAAHHPKGPNRRGVLGNNTSREPHPQYQARGTQAGRAGPPEPAEGFHGQVGDARGRGVLRTLRRRRQRRLGRFRGARR